MRITTWANSIFTPTGYGTQAKQFIKVWQELGHEVSFISNWGLQGGHVTIGDIMMYPDSHDPMTVAAYLKHAQADILFTFWDVWAIPVRKFTIPWVAYFPIDGYPVSAQVGDNIGRCDYAVVYSRFAKQQVEDAGYRCFYVPHMLDLETFKPGDKQAARKQLGVDPDVFLVTCVAANKGYPARKAWAEILQGFARFNREYPDSMLYLHTSRDPIGPGPHGGIQFDPLMKQLDLPGDAQAIAFPDQGALAIGLGDPVVARIYQASDVLLCPSMAEGFGLPIAEAQCCGCPVITQDCSSMTEITINGIAIEPLQPWWVPSLNYWWQLPSIDRIAGALETVYHWSERQRNANAKRGIKYFREHHSPEVVGEQWRTFLDMVENNLDRFYT